MICDFVVVLEYKDLSAIESDLAAEIKSCSQQVLHAWHNRSTLKARPKTLPK